MTHQARLLIRLICASAGVLATTRVDAQCAPERPPDDPLAKITHRAPIPARADVPTLNWPYQQWLTEDVACIITPEERSAFLQLNTDQDRNNFIEQFWYRRNPDPDSESNAFKAEHYSRIEYADQHFKSSKPGWATDRGFVYIRYGSPDEVRSYPKGPLPEPGVGDRDGYPFEDWRYLNLEGAGTNVEFEFVDPSGANDYAFTWSADNLELLFKPPQVQIRSGTPGGFSAVRTSPIVRFKDLSAMISAGIIRAQLRFDYHISVVPLTDCSAVAKIKVVIPSMQPTSHQESAQVFGRISRGDGRILATFEAELSQPNSIVELTLEKDVPLFYGSYDLTVVVKDPASKKIGIQRIPLILPRPSQN